MKQVFENSLRRDKQPHEQCKDTYLRKNNPFYLWDMIAKQEYKCNAVAIRLKVWVPISTNRKL